MGTFTPETETYTPDKEEQVETVILPKIKK